MSGRADTLSLRLDRDEALRYLGYTGQKLDEGLRARFEELAGACERILRPACVRAMFEIDVERSCWEGDEPCVVLAGTSLALTGRDIAAHLRGARKAALLACTLGAASERELRKHAALGPTDGLLYDAAASALVEAAADAAKTAIVEEVAACGLHANFRFSPGYGDFPLDVQPAFLAALDASRRIGVATTSGNLLVPSKSITAVVGLFDCQQRPADKHNACASCRLHGSCPFREKGITCYG